MIILVFGDSIACGCWDKEGGWVDRLKKFTHQKYLSDLDNAPDICNLSINGDLSEGLLQRLRNEIKPRISAEMIIIFAIGINDSEYLNDRREFLTPPEKFRIILKQLAKIGQEYSSKIIFLGLTPVDDSRVDPCPWVPERSYRNENVKKYNQIIKEECFKNKVEFVEIFEKFSQLDYKKLLIDGVHPNTQGHESIFEITKNFLIKEKII